MTQRWDDSLAAAAVTKCIQLLIAAEVGLCARDVGTLLDCQPGGSGTAQAKALGRRVTRTRYPLALW